MYEPAAPWAGAYNSKSIFLVSPLSTTLATKVFGITWRRRRNRRLYPEIQGVKFPDPMDRGRAMLKRTAVPLPNLRSPRFLLMTAH
jgi:hypothetical protein